MLALKRTLSNSTLFEALVCLKQDGPKNIYEHTNNIRTDFG